ncbi:glycoside hydrolase family 3 protein [Clostridium felsineum]|uniref:beta-N-acetylhexosaminidase n=1 Tax=Clostridium felsineum TaxID=36839 RepID=A0A1S8LLA3_9CLOT|nr:glycoside hydrolase family 3 N-terminal domain-containing protein [Clostridium felsineum]URZ04198.1 Beta-N-acetylglucosaminidase/beta-glucosidase [Clostridium felsineum]URZ07613.1 Beta-N-acetylglucosaminidase/beta-glucosidase [Clostridium felsineum]URZ12644.1 Beta-N-acetylglucosaminidase/beta-glucosidase [Clostridium felsineum]
MINLKANPFYLKEEDISWVYNTLKSMNLKEKVGQLFCPVGITDDEEELKAFVNKIKPGGMMYRPGKGEDIRRTHKVLQDNSKIPLLLAANLEAGGNGIAVDGTYFGKQMQVAATDDEKMAYKLGLVAGREGRAVGCNWAFAPIVDIDMNFRNPITNVRTYGSDPKRVVKMAKNCMKGMNEAGVAVSIKHFPGDGVDERDQHLLSSVNSLSVEEWDKTYGMVYKEMIEAGAQTVMAGHIMLPSYSKKLNPALKDEEIMPATLSKELLNDLLREKLGFNGLIATDATAMIGFNVAEKREVAVPKAIASGCDVFLFNKNVEEDFKFMLKGIENNILTLERVDEAVIRILATKAALGLHKQKKENTLVFDEKELKVLKCQEHEVWAKECADKSVTLVKDTQKLLPIIKEKYKRIRLYVLGDTDDGGFKEGEKVSYKVKEKLENAGFEVDIFDNKRLDFREVFEGGIEELKAKYDLALYVANIETASNQTTVRIDWIHLMAANAPWFVRDIPTMFISMANPYHLLDVPMIKTFINAYSSSEYVLDAVIEKITGKSEFKGISPVDPFCNVWGTRF